MYSTAVHTHNLDLERQTSKTVELLQADYRYNAMEFWRTFTVILSTEQLVGCVNLSFVTMEMTNR